MSFYQPVGDTLALIRLAYDLYNKGKQVQNAPEDFKNLLQDIFAVRNAIYRLGSQWGLLDLDQPTVEHLQTVIRHSLEALQQFEPIVVKYQKLAFSQRGQWLSKLQYTKDKGPISKCQKRLFETRKQLMLALQIEQTVHTLSALPQPPTSGVHFTTINSSRLGIVPESSAHPEAERQPLYLEQSGSYETPSFLHGLQRIQTLDSERGSVSIRRSSGRRSIPDGAHLEQNDLPDDYRRSAEVPHHVSIEDFEEDIEACDPFTQPNTHDAPSSTNTRNSRPPRSIHTRSDSTSQAFANRRSSQQHRSSISFQRESLFAAGEGHSQHFETLYPLSKQEMLDVETTMAVGRNIQCFEDKLRDNLSAILARSTTDLLTRAVWWNLKSQRIHTLLKEHSPEAWTRNRPTWPSSVTVEQVFVDLLKSRALVMHLVNIENEDENKGRFTKAQSKVLFDLSMSIQYDLQQQDTSELADAKLLAKDFCFSERRFQAVEEDDAMPTGLDEPRFDYKASRWITVYEDDAGRGGEETILYRTFVNAQIGSNDVRRKSTTAPYMFIVWSPTARSEIRISLINSSGTVNLSRVMTLDDLEALDSRQQKREFRFDFPSQRADICFLNDNDLEAFLKIPRDFFSQMKERFPRKGEFLIFQGGVERIDNLGAIVRDLPKEHSMSGRMRGSCEISLFGDISNKCWKMTRRLVVSSPPGTPEPWCLSYWLPLGGLYCQYKEKDLEMQWSDCANGPVKSRDHYNPTWSYIYDDTEPNRSLNLRFETPEAAKEMAERLLRPFETGFEIPQFEFLKEFGTTQEIRVFRLQDLDASEKYSAVVTIDHHPSGTFRSSVYVLQDEFDVEFDRQSDWLLRFEKLEIPHYTSTVTNYTEDPSKLNLSPEFKAVKIEYKQVNFHLANGEEIGVFLNCLLGWELQYASTAREAQFGGFFFGEKSKDVIVCLWTHPGETGNDIRLTVHCPETTRSARWFTMPLNNMSELTLSDAHKIVVANAEVRQGPRVNGRTLQAADYRGQIPYRKLDNSKVTIVFRNPTDASDFVAHTRPAPRKGALVWRESHEVSGRAEQRVFAAQHSQGNGLDLFHRMPGNPATTMPRMTNNQSADGRRSGTRWHLGTALEGFDSRFRNG